MLKIESMGTTIKINNLINNILNILSPRQKKIIMGRFGLNGKVKTLQELGDSLQITRERVRQIENQSIKKIRKEFANLPKETSEFINFAKKHLENCGGIREEKAFINDLVILLHLDRKVSFLDHKIKFIFLVKGEPFYEEESENFNAYWYLDLKHKENFLKFAKQMKEFLENSSKDGVLKNKLYLKQCKNFLHCHLLAIPKFFAFNVFGDFGLKGWPEIAPRSMREKAYLVLQKARTPLHFSEIAKRIYKWGLSKKVPHMQTVHNELIKDKRFVLVGRGLYTLAEFGFEHGTVKDIITKFIKKHGPLRKEKIIELVRTQRIVKESTITLNLLNKRHFKKLPDGSFDIKEV